MLQGAIGSVGLGELWVLQGAIGFTGTVGAIGAIGLGELWVL